MQRSGSGIFEKTFTLNRSRDDNRQPAKSVYCLLAPYLLRERRASTRVGTSNPVHLRCAGGAHPVALGGAWRTGRHSPRTFGRQSGCQFLRQGLAAAATDLRHAGAGRGKRGEDFVGIRQPATPCLSGFSLHFGVLSLPPPHLSLSLFLSLSLSLSLSLFLSLSPESPCPFRAQPITHELPRTVSRA